MIEQLRTKTASGANAVIAHSTRADGDLSPSDVEPATLRNRRAAAVVGEWYALHQVHGRHVVVVDEHTDSAMRPQADALVTDRDGAVLAVHSGDCVPVGFVHQAGAVGVAHAGWRGLEAGVLAATLDALRTLAGDGQVQAVVGPHVRVANYEFGADALDRIVGRVGPSVRGVTSTGTPALDLTEWTRLELARLDVAVAALSPSCTAAEADDFWSYRARGEDGRIALIAHLEPEGAT